MSFKSLCARGPGDVLIGWDVLLVDEVLDSLGKETMFAKFEKTVPDEVKVTDAWAPGGHEKRNRCGGGESGASSFGISVHEDIPFAPPIQLVGGGQVILVTEDMMPGDVEGGRVSEHLLEGSNYIPVGIGQLRGFVVGKGWEEGANVVDGYVELGAGEVEKFGNERCKIDGC